jgi:GTP-binding protein
VILVADDQLTTLLDCRYRRHYKGGRGQHGEGKNKTGRQGEPLELRVPPGTIVTDLGTGTVLGEMLESGQRMIVAKGGRGGRGNVRFTSATHQAPRHWEPGEEGEEREIELVVKLIADVGLVGEPNAGKSTLLSSVSAAHPKVADYPFTTLSPNLGVVSLSDYRSFVIADIPGIIEGAHEGKGLGLQFLQHIERTRTLAILVPVDSPDPQTEYEALRTELSSYSEDLSKRPHCVVLSKTDVLSPEAELPSISAPDAWGVFHISSVTQAGLQELLENLWQRVQEYDPASATRGGWTPP